MSRGPHSREGPPSKHQKQKRPRKPFIAFLRSLGFRGLIDESSQRIAGSELPFHSPALGQTEGNRPLSRQHAPSPGTPSWCALCRRIPRATVRTGHSLSIRVEEQPSEHESQHRTTIGSPISGRGNPHDDAPDIPPLTKRFPVVSNRPSLSRLFARQEIPGTSGGDRSAGRGFLKRVLRWDEVNRP